MKDLNFKVLITEDDPINCFLIKALMEVWSVEYLWAQNGIEAIEILNHNNDIKLIFMDINMPRMDGITATKKIRETGISIPIIFQSAYSDDEDIQACINAGGNEFICKPIVKEKFYHTVSKYLQYR